MSRVVPRHARMPAAAVAGAAQATSGVSPSEGCIEP